jgi:hypothetical protein
MADTQPIDWKAKVDLINSKLDKAVANTKSLIDLIEQANILPIKRINPVLNTSIVIYFTDTVINNTRYGYFECIHDGSIVMALAGHNPIILRKYPVDISKPINDLLTQIKDFINPPVQTSNDTSNGTSNTGNTGSSQQAQS